MDRMNLMFVQNL